LFLLFSSLESVSETWQDEYQFRLIKNLNIVSFFPLSS